MGLDMYLTRKVYIGANYEHNKVTGTIALQKDGKDIPVELNKVKYIEEDAAYWRKANSIHNWFVETVQDGEDDCKEYYVDKEQLKELVEICNKVIKSLEKSGKKTIQVETGWTSSGKTYGDSEVFTDTSLAEELLPTQSGFFFGGTDYNIWYLEELKNTVEQLTPIIEKEGDFAEYYYQASW